MIYGIPLETYFFIFATQNPTENPHGTTFFEFTEPPGLLYIYILDFPIHEFSIMSELINPLSRKMDGKHTCSVIHFQKVQGGGEVQGSISQPSLYKAYRFCSFYPSLFS